MKRSGLKIPFKTLASVCLITLLSLTVGSNMLSAAPEDNYEQEADRVADTVRRPSPVMHPDTSLKSQSLKSEKIKSGQGTRRLVQPENNISIQSQQR